MDYVKEAYNHYAIEVHGAREVQHAVSIIWISVKTFMKHTKHLHGNLFSFILFMDKMVIRQSSPYTISHPIVPIALV
jgi:hypothetical protein